MTKQDIKNMLKAEFPAVIDDGTYDSWIEAGRLMVAAADGRHSWNNLIEKTTVSIVSGTSDYTLPTSSSAALIDKILAIEGQLETDTPIKIYSVEEAAETDFTNDLGIILLDWPEKGKVKIRIKPTPAAAVTYDVWYKSLVEDDDFDFVSTANQDVFYWAALIFAYKKSQDQPGVGDRKS